MMLSKSRDEVESSAAQKPKPLDAQKKAQEVADLERRLKDLSTTTTVSISRTSTTPSTQVVQVVPSARPAVTVTANTNAGTSNAGGGKNALLARIMAAQERAKNQQQAHGPSPVVEGTTAPPAFAIPPPLESPTFASMSSPPPAFASPPPPAMFAPPPPPDYFAAPPPPAPPTMFMAPPLHTSADTLTAPPPSFDFLDSFGIGPHPPTFEAMSLPPKQEAPPPAFRSGFSAPEAPSAPSFDLLMMDPAPVPPAMPPPAMPPPQTTSSSTGLDDEAIQVILAMEGMSDADKQQLIQEQMNIMKSIEKTKRKGSNAQISAADAFEQRSFSANVQAAGSRTTIHGPERTRRALADGATVVTVQCAACDTLLQVTGAAQFMFCPTCQTVTPVVADNQDATDRAQLEADMKLAQELQKEEYESADRQEQRRATAATATAKPPSANGTTSWMEWLGLSSTPTPAAATARSEEDVVSFERSGQTAEKAPLFACVTDSISSAANYALNLPQDEEGNVHGVDSTSLLAVPQVGRNTTKSPPS